MANSNNNRIIFSFSVILLLSIITLSSCNPRQARIVNKIIHDIDHAVEEGPYQDDGQDSYQAEEQDYYQDNNSTQTSRITRYNVSGVCQHENGRIENIGNGVVVIQTPDGLFLADGYGNPRDRVYKNDVQSITETHVVRYSFDEDETELRPYNVSGYAYKCYNGISTLYFNIYN